MHLKSVNTRTDRRHDRRALSTDELRWLLDTTANGPARAAEVKLGMVSVGRAEVEDVQAFVIDSGLETSLLGMTYLGRLSKFEATQDALVLKS